MKMVKKMKLRKNYRDVWLEDERMEQQFPDLVKYFSYGGKGWGEDDETILNLYGFEFKKEKANFTAANLLLVTNQRQNGTAQHFRGILTYNRSQKQRES